MAHIGFRVKGFPNVGAPFWGVLIMGIIGF